MSTPTETDFLDENTQNVQQDTTTTPVAPETALDQQEHQHHHKHDHDHTHEDGELSPMCAGGGCVQKTSA